MTQESQRLTQQQAQARYDSEVATILASNEHPQVAGMAINDARRWLDQALEAAPADASAITLGQRLRQNIAEAERLRLNKEERASREARERRERHIREVSLALEGLKSKITSSIEEGSIPKAMRLPRVVDALAYSNTPITNFAHPDHHQWHEEMESWAESQGLVLEVFFEHDGMGMESWHSVKVSPR